MSRALEKHAAQLGALGHPARLTILRCAVQAGEEGASVGTIQSKVKIPASTLSHHLDRLAREGLLEARRDGTFIYYSAQFPALKQLTEFLWEDCCKGGASTCC